MCFRWEKGKKSEIACNSLAVKALLTNASGCTLKVNSDVYIWVNTTLLKIACKIGVTWNVKYDLCT